MNDLDSSTYIAATIDEGKGKKSNDKAKEKNFAKFEDTDLTPHHDSAKKSLDNGIVDKLLGNIQEIEIENIGTNINCWLNELIHSILNPDAQCDLAYMGAKNINFIAYELNINNSIGLHVYMEDGLERMINEMKAEFFGIDFQAQDFTKNNVKPFDCGVGVFVESKDPASFDSMNCLDNIDTMINNMTMNSRAVIIIPKSVINNPDNNSYFKELVNHFILNAIINLPNNSVEGVNQELVMLALKRSNCTVSIVDASQESLNNTFKSNVLAKLKDTSNSISSFDIMTNPKCKICDMV